MKQIIIMRDDLVNCDTKKNVNTGKLIAQGAHASMGALLESLKETKIEGKDIGTPLLEVIDDEHSEVYRWLGKAFTKIVVGCSGEKELMELYYEAKLAGLTVCLIEDNGLTEFGGVRTATCLGIGPHESTKIDAVTKKLKLFKQK